MLNRGRLNRGGLVEGLKNHRVMNRRLLLPGSASVTPNTYGATLWLKGDYATEQSERARDSSGQENHGAVYSGRAMQFDGVGDYVLTNHTSTSDIGTIALTFSIPAPMNPGEVVCGHRGAGDYESAIYAGNGSTLYYYLNGQAEILFAGLSVGTAYRLVITFDGTTLRSYMDGAATGYEAAPVPGNAEMHEMADSIGASAGTGSGAVQADVADFQFWEGVWDDEDVLFDFENPEKLASERPGTALDGRPTSQGGDLAGHWWLGDGFNDADWDLVLDSSGNGNHGTNVSAGAAHLTGLGAGWPQMVYRGWSRQHYFDDTDANYVNCGSAAVFESSAFTVAAWIILPTVAADQYAICGNAYSYNVGGFVLRTENDDLYLYCSESGAESGINASNVLSADTLHHVVAKRANNGDVAIFLDGSSVATGNINYDPRSGNFLIGRRGDAGADFTGVVLEATFFDTDLSTAEIEELHNSGNPLDATTHSKAANLVGYWRNTGRATWEDLSGNGNDGTVNGSPDAIYIPTAPGSTVNDGLGFPLTNPRDVEAFNVDWIQARAVDIADDASIQNIWDGGGFIGFFVKGYSKGPNNMRYLSKRRWEITHISADQEIILFVEFSGTNGNWIMENSPVSQMEFGNWYFVGVSYNADDVSNVPTLYLNGTDAGLESATQPTGTRISDAGQELTIAQRYNDTLAMDGLEADVFILPNGEPTAAQVQALYNALKGKYSL